MTQNKKIAVLIIISFGVLFGLTSCLTIVADTMMQSKPVGRMINSLADDVFTSLFQAESDIRTEVLNHKEQFMKEHNNGKTVTAEAFDGAELIGHFYSNENSHKYIIASHGLFQSNEQAMDSASYFYDYGYSILTFDLRGHGDSEDTIWLGIKDCKDFVAWANWVVEYDSEAEIVLMGSSISGFSVLSSLDKGLPENVKCVISDCGFINVGKTATYFLEESSPIRLSELFNIVNNVVEFRTGKTLYDLDASESLENTEIPILLILGSNDLLVPVTENDKIIDLVPEGIEVESAVFDHAGHEESIFIDPNRYLEIVFDFCGTYIH